MKRLEARNEVDSDHCPLIIGIDGGKRRRGENKKKRKEKKIWKGKWDEERKEGFTKELGGVNSEEEKIQEEGKRITERAKNILKDWEREKERKEGYKRGSWDEECRKRKKEVRRKWWRKGEEEGEKYRTK